MLTINLCYVLQLLLSIHTLDSNWLRILRTCCISGCKWLLGSSTNSVPFFPSNLHISHAKRRSRLNVRSCTSPLLKNWMSAIFSPVSMRSSRKGDTYPEWKICQYFLHEFFNFSKNIIIKWTTKCSSLRKICSNSCNYSHPVICPKILLRTIPDEKVSRIEKYQRQGNSS